MIPALGVLAGVLAIYLLLRRRARVSGRSVPKEFIRNENVRVELGFYELLGTVVLKYWWAIALLVLGMFVAGILGGIVPLAS